MFKNYLLYSLDKKLDLESLETRLESFKSKEPSKTGIETVGFWSPFPTNDGLSHTIMNSHYFNLRFFKKNIPSKLVNYRLGQKIRKAEEQGNPVSKKQRQELKEEIINHIASNTPAVPDSVNFMYDEDELVLCVDTSSNKKAETCISLLRKAIGSVPCKPLIPFNIASLLTSWCFENNLPDCLTVKEKGKLKALDETKAEASFNNQFMDAEEVIAARDSGKYLVQIALQFEDDFLFSFTEDGSVKSIKYTDFKLEEISEIPKSNEAELLDAQLALNTDSVRKFVKFVKEEIGDS